MLGLFFMLSLLTLLSAWPLVNASLTLDNLIGVGLILAGLFWSLKRRSYVGNWLLILSVLCLFGLVSSLIQADSLAGFLGMFSRALYRGALIYSLLILTDIINSPRRAEAIFGLVVGISVFESLLGILAFIFNYSGPYGLGMVGSRDYSWLAGLVPGRIVGTFISGNELFLGSNLLATFLNFGIILTLGFILVSRLRLKLFYILFLIIQLVALFLTYTRSSLVILVLAIIPLTFFIPKKRLIFWFYLLICLLALIIPGVPERFFLDPFSDRQELVWQAWQVIKNNWFFGIGPGNFVDYLSADPLAYEANLLTNPHNGYLLVWAEYGLIGFLFFVWFLVSLIKPLFNFKSVPNQARYWQICLSSAILAFLGQNLFNNFFFIFSVSGFFWLLSSVGLKLRKLNNQTLSS